MILFPLTTLSSVRDTSSQIREQTLATPPPPSAVEAWRPTHWTTREVPQVTLIGSQGCDPLSYTGGSDGKESACDARDLGSIPGLRRSLEESVVTLSSILAWRIPWTEEPGGLQSMGLQRVEHN